MREGDGDIRHGEIPLVQFILASCECLTVLANRLNIGGRYNSLIEARSERTSTDSKEGTVSASDTLVSQPEIAVNSREECTISLYSDGNKMLELNSKEHDEQRYFNQQVKIPINVNGVSSHIDTTGKCQVLSNEQHNDDEEIINSLIGESTIDSSNAFLPHTSVPSMPALSPREVQLLDEKKAVGASHDQVFRRAKPSGETTEGESFVANSNKMLCGIGVEGEPDTESTADMISRIANEEWKLAHLLSSDGGIPRSMDEEVPTTDIENVDEEYTRTHDDFVGFADSSAPGDPEDWEPLEDYRPGGYHPAEIGDILQGRYKLTMKLGWGMYSTVWRGSDHGRGIEKKPLRTVALKIQKSHEDYYDAAKNEIKLLKLVQSEENRLKRSSFVVHLLDEFDIFGKFGKHPCMVFEELGESLCSVLQRFGHISMESSKAVVVDILEGLGFLHQCGILHTDLKPENILVYREPGNARTGRSILLGYEEDEKGDYVAGVKIVDLGNALLLDDQDVFDIQTREYRCPESMLGILPFLPQADIWSLGCLIFELVTGEILFDPTLPEGLDENDPLVDDGTFALHDNILSLIWHFFV